MTGNPHPQASGAASPTDGNDGGSQRAAQKSPRDTARSTSPLTAHSPSTAVTSRSDSILPTGAARTTSPRAVVGELLDAITEARRRLLDRLAHT